MPERDRDSALPDNESDLERVLEETPFASKTVLLERYLDAHPTSELALERLCRERTSRGEWEQLAVAYERLIGEQSDPDSAVRICVAHARLLSDPLSDPKRAVASIERAAELQPRNVELQLEAAAIHERCGDSRTAEAHTLAALKAEPLNAAVHHRLCTFFAASGDVDRAWQAGAVLCYLGLATSEERDLYEQYRSGELPRPARELRAEDLALGLSPGAFNPEFANVIELVADAALAWVEPDRHLLSSLRSRLRLEDVETSTTTLARSLSWTSRLLSVPTPALYLVDGAEPPSPLPIAEPAWMIGKEAGRGSSLPEMAFTWARSLGRNSGAARVLRLFGDDDSLETLLSACFIAARKSLPDQTDEAVELALAMRQRLSQERLTELGRLLDGARWQDWLGRLHVWLDEVVYSANRLGLLASGDPNVAARALGQLGFQKAQLKEQLSDLFRFALGNEYSELRKRLKLSLDSKLG